MCSPKLAARVRLLEAGDTNKTDPDDARSVAVAALRSKGRQEVTADDHAAVLKVRAKRHRDLARTRNQVVCRLHAVLCDLVPGGVPEEITAGQAARILGRRPRPVRSRRAASSPPSFAGRHPPPGRPAARGQEEAGRRGPASGTSLTEVSGVGPVIAGTVIGDVIDVARFPGRGHFAACNGTAPVEVSCGKRKIHRLSLRGNRRINHAVHMAAINWIRHKHSDGRACYERSSPRARRARRRCGRLKRRISDAIFARLQADAGRCRSQRGPGRATGERLWLQRGRLHPGHRLFGQATPGPSHQRYGPGQRFSASLPRMRNPSRQRGKPSGAT